MSAKMDYTLCRQIPPVFHWDLDDGGYWYEHASARMVRIVGDYGTSGEARRHAQGMERDGRGPVCIACLLTDRPHGG